MADDINVEITPPKLFTKNAIVVLNAYSVLLLVPLIIVIFLVPLIFKFFKPEMALCLYLVAVGLAACLCLYFLPLGLGNPHVRRLIRRLNFSEQNGFIIQLASMPRLKSGVWSFMEDADDLGVLSFGEEKLVFKGDSFNFSFPYTRMNNVRKKNIGWRGFWLYGNRITVEVSEPVGNRTFEFTERLSLSLPASRRISKELYNLLSAKIQK